MSGSSIQRRTDGHRAGANVGRRRDRVIAVVLGISLLVTNPLGASATNWGAGDSTYPGYSILCTAWDDPHFSASECTPNNDVQSVWIATTIPSGLRTALINSMDNDYDPLPGVAANLNTYIDSLTDVRVFYWTEDTSLPIAFTTCAEFATIARPNVRYHMSCTPQDILYQAYTTATNCWNSSSCRNHYACHELGHTFGLQTRPI